jgi:7-cyano-7-deazaguanine synthase
VNYERQRLLRYLSDMSAHPRNAVVLLSGGLDSTTVLALATREGFSVHTLSFRYGQRHAHEIDAARRIAAQYNVARHEVMNIDLRVFGGSALTADVPVPRRRTIQDPDDIPVTYVPARNTIFLSYALAYAEVTESRHIFIGVNALDYSGYPDCRPEYIAAFERMANLATRAGVNGSAPVRIVTPLIDLNKARIIELGTSLGVNYAQTTSCYDPAPDGTACGECDACQLRLKGFADAGIADPVSYAVPVEKQGA